MHCLRHKFFQILSGVILCLCCFGCLAHKERVVSGVLHGEHVWQGNVYVSGDVVLEKDVKLTIMPGTKVRFLQPGEEADSFKEHPNFPGSELIIRGTVTAIGTSQQPIIFEAADQALPSGSWGAVNIEGSPEAIFEYCIFRQADSAVHSRDSHVYIEQSIFLNNLVGVRFHDTQMLIEKNLFQNNDAAVRFHFGSPVICENEFSENNVNMFITSHPSDYHIENNSFGLPLEYHVVFGEEVPEDVKMERNYWETPRDNALADLIFDGRRIDYLGKVLFEPMRSVPSKLAGPSWSP
jgi:hypothetical protein